MKINELANNNEMDVPLDPESKDSIDYISLDVPLLIRMLEFAREDAPDDLTLHKVAERMIELSKVGALDINDYEKIVGNPVAEETKPWDRKNPAKKHKKLSPSQKAEAKRYAKAHGQPYPSWAANAHALKKG